ncbi:MAG TPA: hypothetical protein VFS99_05395 [Xanthomonadaceae bacterium]|nr:hypothetical protein [Xanthomonadaceae bacterium]
MSRSKLALLLACALSMTMSTAMARDVERLSAGDAGECPADLAAAKADAEEKATENATRSAKPSPAPVRSKPTVRGGDATSPGNRLNAPRWHSFLPGMFR